MGSVSEETTWVFFGMHFVLRALCSPVGRGSSCGVFSTGWNLSAGLRGWDTRTTCQPCSQKENTGTHTCGAAPCEHCWELPRSWILFHQTFVLLLPPGGSKSSKNCLPEVECHGISCFFFINCLKMGGFSLLLFQFFMTFRVSRGRSRVPRVCPDLVPTCRVPQLLPHVQAEHSWGQGVYSKFLAPATSVTGFC